MLVKVIAPILNLLPGVKPVDTLAVRLFGNCRGVFSTFEQARRAVPPHRREGYDNEAAASLYAGAAGSTRPSDYPAIFWISTMLPSLQRVFDFGGNVGLSYYCCRQYLGFPAALEWMVCDLPAVIPIGEATARRMGGTHLRFTPNLSQADGTDLFLTCGTLQYVEEPLAAILGKLKRKPRHVLVNRAAVWDHDSFVTLQDIGAALCPYRVQNKDVFVSSLHSLGYELVDSWPCMESSCRVRLKPARTLGQYSGFYFRLSPEGLQ